MELKLVFRKTQEQVSQCSVRFPVSHKKVTPWNARWGSLSPVKNVQHHGIFENIPLTQITENCKVDIAARQGHSWSTCVKPLLFHYTIRTCDVKRRSHADNIIGSLYGRSKSMTPCSPWERWGNCGVAKPCWRAHVQTFLTSYSVRR